MSELDLLNLARSCGQNISSGFAQVITITFAMVVAIYYFLHQAGIRMKIFAFIIYTIGILAYLGMMLLKVMLASVPRRPCARFPPRSWGDQRRTISA